MQANHLAAALLTAQFGAAEAKQQEPENPDAQAYTFDSVYTGDLWRNTTGGLRTGGVYLDNLDVTLEVDGERAWSVPGLTAFIYALYNNNASFTGRYVGDAMTLSNIDTSGAVRLYEAWLEWTSASALPLSLRLGLYDLNAEFDTTESRALFINSTHGIGHDFGQTGANGPSIFPVTSLAVRAAWEFAPGWRVLAAVLDGVPGEREHPEHSGIHLGSDEGALAAVELQWSGGRVNKLSVGHWQYTADFDDLRSTETEAYPEHDDNAGAYAAVEVGLDRSAAAGDWRTTAFVRYGVANGDVNEFDETFALGIRRRGLLGARPDDELGLAYAWAATSSALRTAAAAAGAPRDSHESAIELTYRAPINDWLTLQPDVQFIINPGADPTLSDSLAVGLRFELSLAAYN